MRTGPPLPALAGFIALAIAASGCGEDMATAAAPAMASASRLTCVGDLARYAHGAYSVNRLGPPHYETTPACAAESTALVTECGE